MRCSWHSIPGVLLLGVVSVSADMSVWSENALLKVRPTDPPKATFSVTISAARNEYEPFQIVIRAEGHPLRGVDVDLTDFHSGSGNRISCKTNCTVYREVYYNAVRRSGPYGEVGEWPDALIPKVDRYFGEQRNAFPINIAENRNQPIWIDVYVPAEATPGLYTAYVSVRARGQQTIRIPVYLTVWGFTLPATSSIKNTFLLYGGALPYGHGTSFKGEKLDGLVKTYSKGLLAHRLSNGWLIGGYGWQPSQLTQWTSDSLARLKQEWGPFFDGTVLPSGSRITSVNPLSQMCVDGKLTFLAGVPDEIAWRNMCTPEVIEFLATAGWLDRTAFYLPDEPNLSDPSLVLELKSIADSIHQRDNRLRTLLTSSYSDVVQPQTDIWVVPLPELRESFDNGSYWSTYAQEKALGKEVWVYQACFEHGCSEDFPSGLWSPWYPGMSGLPDYMIDMQGMKNRIQDWINWRLNVQGELYWGVNVSYYWFDVYHNQFIAGGNGDGNFLYPGTPERIGGMSDIPIESIRLKLKREGLEDYEYLALLARVGNSTFADSKAAELVRSAHDWEQDPAVLYRLRDEIAVQLEILTGSRSDPRKPFRDARQ